jgi:hypothetical protein
MTTTSILRLLLLSSTLIAHAAVLNTHMHIEWKLDLPMYAGFTEVPEPPQKHDIDIDIDIDLSHIDLFYQKQHLLQHITDPTLTQVEKLASFLYWEKMEHLSLLVPQWEAGGLFRDWEQDIV